MRTRKVRGGGIIEKGLMNGKELNLVALPKGEDSKWDSFWMGPLTCGLMSMGVTGLHPLKLATPQVSDVMFRGSMYSGMTAVLQPRLYEEV